MRRIGAMTPLNATALALGLGARGGEVVVASEAEQVEEEFVAATGVKLVVVDAKERFLGALAGVTPHAPRVPWFSTTRLEWVRDAGADAAQLCPPMRCCSAQSVVRSGIRCRATSARTSGSREAVEKPQNGPWMPSRPAWPDSSARARSATGFQSPFSRSASPPPS